MQLQLAEHATPRLELSIAGRRYPVATPAAPDASLENRKHKIVEVLWSRLTLPATTSDEMNSIVRTYDTDRQLIANWRGEIRTLFAAVAEASFELRATSDSSKPEMQRIICAQQENSKEKFAFPISPPDKTLSAELLLNSAATVQRELVQELRDRLNGLATDLFSTLDRLVNERAIGLIEWLGDSLCRFHFFRDVVIHDSQTIASEAYAVIRDSKSGRLMTQVSEVRNQSGSNTFRISRHEHELMNAVTETIDDSSLIIPETVQLVLDSIPDWLVPMSRIVSGDCVRERIIERDLRTEEWQSTDTEVVRVYFDPAVTIGDYVLVGWSEADIHREEQAQLVEQQRAATDYRRIRARRESWMASITGLAFLVCTPGVAFVGAVFSAWIYLPATGLGLLGLGCLGYGLYQSHVSKDKPINYEWICTLLVLAGFSSILVSALGVALLSPSIVAWAFALVSFVVVAYIVRNIEPPL